MSYLKRFAYMGFGALLVLALVIGGVAAFAQGDDQSGTPAAQDDGSSAAQDGEPAVPAPDFHGGRFDRGNDDELLADALGISVEELEAAEQAAYVAALNQAVEQGLITEEQAAQLQGQGYGRWFPRGLNVDKQQLLADALNISVAELEAAQADVRAARLAAMVEAGVLTQEEADLMAAREAVQGYIDQEALAETVQNAYEAAVAQALDDGVITQDQADQLLANISTFDFRFDGFGRGFDDGMGRGGPHGGRHHNPGNFFAPGADNAAPALEGTTGA